MIFPWIWSVLPGPAWVRAILIALLVVAAVAVLFQWVFPWVSVTFDIQDQNVEASG